MNIAPVLPSPDGVELLDPLTAGQGGEDRRLFVLAVGWYQQGDRLAHDLVRGIAEDPMGRFVPAGDDAGQRLADDGVSRRIDDRRQLEAVLVGPLAFGDVADGARHQHAAFGRERAEADLDRNLAPVLAATEELDLGPHGPGPGLRKIATAMGRVSRAEALRDQHLDRQPQQLGARVAKQELSLAVDDDDLPAAVDDDDGVGRGLQQATEGDHLV